MVSEFKPIIGMYVSGYITSTITNEGVVRYGPFGSRESARAWAKELVGDTEIFPIYAAVYSRG